MSRIIARLHIFLCCAVFFWTANVWGQLTTTDLTLNYDAQAPGNTATNWAHNNPAISAQFNWGLNGAVLNTAPTTARAGITAAYTFNASNANQLVGQANNATDAFDNLPGNPSDESASWEFWFQPDSVANNAANDFVLWESGGAGDGSSFTIIDGDTARFTLKDGGSNLIVNAALAGLGGEFTQAVASYDRNTGGVDTLNLYINGALVDTDVELDNDVNDWDGGDNASIGDRGSTTGGHNASGGLNFNNPFEGEIAIFRFYGDDLTAAEVADNFAAVNATDVFFDDGDAGDSNWSSGENWDTNLEPTSAQNAFIGGPGAGPTAEITTAGEVANQLVIGHNNGAAPAGTTGTGTLDMTGGTLDVNQIRIGQNGQDGTFNLIDGDVTVTDTLGGQAVQIGDSGGSTAVFTIGDGVSTPTLTSTGGRFEVGTANNATATFNMNSGTVNIANQNLILGQGDANDVVTINFNGGTFTNTGGANYNINDGDATHNHTGGTLNIGNNLNGNNGGADGDFFDLNLSGGTINIGNNYNGRNGNDTITVSGTGVLNIGNNFDTSNTGAREFALNINPGGTVNITGNFNDRNSTGTLTMNGSGAALLDFDFAGSGGGGTMDIDILNGNNTDAVIDLGNGGLTVNDSGAFSGSIQGATATLLYNGGNTLLLDGNNTYGGATTVGGNSILNIASDNALGAATGNTTVNGGSQLRLTGDITTPVGEDITINGGGAPGSNGAIRSHSGDNVINGIVSMGSNAQINAVNGTLTINGIINGFGGNEVLTLGGSGDGTLNGGVAPGAGTGSIVKTGTGTWTLTAPDNNVTGNLSVDNGALILDGGDLNNIDQATIGLAGGGAADELRITTNGGSLSTDSNLRVGQDEDGSVTQNNGAVNVGDGAGTDDLVLGNTAGITGTYNINNGSLSIDDNARLGDAANALGILNIDDLGGTPTTVDIGNHLQLGSANSGDGIVNQTAGTVTVQGQGQIGESGNAGASGTYNANGGSVEFVDALRIGFNSPGTMNIDGGDVIGGNSGGSNTVVGFSSDGLLNIDSGTLLVPNTLQIGREAGSSGIYDQDGGVATVNGDMRVGANSGTGVATISAGITDFADSNDFQSDIGTPTASTLIVGPLGDFTLEGTGVVRDVTTIDNTAANSFNFTGGSLVVGSDVFNEAYGGAQQSLATLDADGVDRFTTTFLNDLVIDGGAVVVDIYNDAGFGTGEGQQGNSNPLNLETSSDLLVINGTADLQDVTIEAHWLFNPYENPLEFYDVLYATNGFLGDPNITLAGDASLFRIVDDGMGGQFLQVAAPEPATIAIWTLIGAALFGGYVRRRK